MISDKSRSSVVFRAIFFLPYILGEIVAGLIWRYMYDGNYGVVAVVYRWFGQEAPQVLVALEKKRLAAAISRRLLRRKSTVRPALSTARYR